MQRGLVDHEAIDDRYSVACVCEAQSVKPVGPSGIKMSLEADGRVAGLLEIEAA